MEKESNIIKKITIINIIIVVGLLFANLVIMLRHANDMYALPIYSDLEFFADFTDVLQFSAGKLGEEAQGNYFPFAYVFMRIIEFISFGEYNLIYILTAMICGALYILFCKKFLEKHMGKMQMYLNIIIFLFMQFPMIFLFQRGNIEMIILLFCMLFYILYKKEKYSLAAIVLSLAVCMKLYPALLALLFISKKRYKEFFLCAVSSLGITVASYFIVQDALGSFTHYVGGFTNFLDIYGKLTGMQYNHSILFGIYYFMFEFLNIELYDLFTYNIFTPYTISIICISIPLGLYVTFKKMEEWKKLAILSLMIVAFPQVSFDYTLVLLIIPIIAFITDENTKGWENLTYSILFGLLLIPMNFNERIVRYNTINMGLIVRPIIIIAIILTIIISSIKTKERITE